MKRLVITLLFSGLTFLCFSQIPVRLDLHLFKVDESETLFASDEMIAVRIKIVDDPNSETPLFEETHVGNTNGVGAVDLFLGEGQDQQGDLKALDWIRNQYYIQVECTTESGNNLYMTEPIGAVPVSWTVDEDCFENYLQAYIQVLKQEIESETDVGQLFNQMILNAIQPNGYIVEGQANSIGTDMLQDQVITPSKISNAEGLGPWLFGGPWCLGTGGPHEYTSLTINPDFPYGIVAKGIDMGGAFIATGTEGYNAGGMFKTYSVEGDAAVFLNDVTEGFCYLAGPDYSLWTSTGGNADIWGLICDGWAKFSQSVQITYNGEVGGDFTVLGTLFKGAGAFRIDHPLDPENKYLQHSFVESPDMKNIYDGIANLDSNGEAIVVLPEWFEALNRDFRYQLTCIGGYANVYIADQIQDNRFRIAGGTPGLEVSWQVTGIRKDKFANENRIEVEIPKEGMSATKGLPSVVPGFTSKPGI